MTPVPSQLSPLTTRTDDAGNESGATNSDDPHSPGSSRPLDQLTGLCIGIATVVVPLSVVLADTLMPLYPMASPTWTGSIIRQP
ncbi:MAG: hypothetical protein VKJ87_04580 [Synechococcus sp.]|nr:hypothetical protein [Synechococcus sp.]